MSAQVQVAGSVVHRWWKRSCHETRRGFRREGGRSERRPRRAISVRWSAGERLRLAKARSCGSWIRVAASPRQTIRAPRAPRGFPPPRARGAAPQPSLDHLDDPGAWSMPALAPGERLTRIRGEGSCVSVLRGISRPGRERRSPWQAGREGPPSRSPLRPGAATLARFGSID